MDEEEKVVDGARKIRSIRRLARWMSLGAVIAVNVIICAAILSCSPRILKVSFSCKAIARVGVLVGFGFTSVWIVLQCLGYKKNEVNVDPVKHTVKRRLLVSVIVIVVTLYAVTLSNAFWPLGSIPETIQETPFYASSDSNRLCIGDLGTVARKEGDHLWVCVSVEAYGPFDYGGDPGEISITRLTAGNVAKLEPREVLACPFRKEELYMKVNSYEDGDWVVIKRFIEGQNVFKLQADQSELVTLWDVLGADGIEYITYKSPGPVALCVATDGVLGWEITDQRKLIYTVE